MIIVDKTNLNELASVTKSIFLAGPSPRDGMDWRKTWRGEAVELLKKLDYDGHVFIPLPFEGLSYAETVAWEEKYLEMSDVILFWVPRSDDLPGFTTNVEFGEWMKSGKVVLGYPNNATKMRYLYGKALKYSIPTASDLESSLKMCLELIGDGAKRVGNETKVPLHVWQNESFQQWYQSQRKIGNYLVDAKVLWNFQVGPARKLFSFILKASMYVDAEDRIKDNEFVFTRSDVAVVVAYVSGHDLLSTRVLTVKEYRLPARTRDGFVHELPSGSTFGKKTPLQLARNELHEETGLDLNPNRFVFIGQRQLAATLSSHAAYIFRVELTQEEMESVQGRSAGVGDDTERTYVGSASFKDILSGKVEFDLSMIGAIGAAALTPIDIPSPPAPPKRPAPRIQEEKSIPPFKGA